MKKIFAVLMIGLCAILSAKAEVEFSYEAGAEVVSSYLWRGQYLGGLSFQPSATVGFESEYVNFQGGLWASIGASDWGFRKDQPTVLGLDPNTYFVPEIDFVASVEFFNATVGLTHYYYCDGGNYFGWRQPKNWGKDGYWSGSTTELQFGYNFADFLPEEHNLYVNWYTMVAGNDFKMTDKGLKQNGSSYLELGYDYNWDEYGLTFGAQVGIVPWSSEYYGNDNFAFKNLSLKVNKAWDLDVCELDLYVLGTMDPYMLANDHESAFVKASGDFKIECQSLNGCIGVGVWF